MRGEPLELACPFCDKGKIQCWYIPSTRSEKREVSATFGSKKSFSKTSDVWLIQSGCSVCGKSQEEVEKELKRLKVV